MSEKLHVPFGELLNLLKEENTSADLVWQTKVPAFRAFDISRDVDLVEEILRIYGYTNVEPQRPSLPLNMEIKKPFEEKIRNLLTDRGFNEVVTFPWIEESLREIFEIPSYWEIVNPLNSEQRHMRTSLIPSLVKVQKFNQNNFNRDIAIFELGKVYLENMEIPTLGILAVGKFRKHFEGENEWNFLTFKGVVEALLERFGVENYKILQKKISYMHPYLCGEIFVNGTPIGYFGKLHPEVAEKLELKDVPFVGEINLEELKKVVQKPVYKGIAKFPPVKRDFAFVFPEEEGSADEILQTAKEVFENLLEDIYIFDVYKGEKIGEGKVSVAVRITLRHPEKSLSDEEVNKLSDEFVKTLNKKGYSLRA
jgi:phenylalanyl-tRNA synthetase beta chain